MSRNKLKEGLSISIRRTFSHDCVKAFSKLSGDENPLHLDCEYAESTRFKKPICHGMLVGSLFSNLIGNNFPSSVYISQNFNFLAPVYVNEEVEASVHVISIRKRIVTFETKVCKLSKSIDAISGQAIVLMDNIESYL